jgi:SfnB family sulfur acquisition oxidoreductase
MVETAHVIRSDAEALEVASRLAESFRAGARRRDRERCLPHDELLAFSRSGLWGMTVPRSHGGAQVSYATVAKVFAIISAADSSIGQIAQNHISAVHFIRAAADPVQRAHFLGKVLQGERFGNASSESGTTHGGSIQTRLARRGSEDVISGRKFYSTGALFAHYVTVMALDDQDRRWVAILERETPGLTIIDDWQGFGQRTTASGTVTLDDVVVPGGRLVPVHLAYERSPQGAVSQITHVGIDAGIARGAIQEAIDLVRSSSGQNPRGEAVRASDDPYVLSQIGDLTIRLHAAEAMMERAGRGLDAALANPSEETETFAFAAVAEAKVLTTEIALLATNQLFELVGADATASELGLDRHWRNARTHTLHDPVRWRINALGNHYLNNLPMPRR